MNKLYTILPAFFFLSGCIWNHQNYKVENVVSNGVQISYTLCGEGDTTLLFVHGWGINKEYWKPQLKEFCPQYKVAAIDLPGFGHSGTNRSDWSFDAYASDIKNVIDQLKLKNVILLGHSMSGDIILKVDNIYPKSVIGVVGIDNLHEPGSPLSAQQQQQTDSFFVLLTKSFDSTVKNFMSVGLFQQTTPKEVSTLVLNDVFNCDSAIAIKVLRSLTETAQQEKQMMRGLSHKLYLVNSDVNPIQPDSLSKYCAKGFKAELVHGTGHYPMLEKPEEFNAALRKVIAEIAKGN